MENKEIKDYYTYYFADGTKSIVTAKDVGQKWIDILYEMDEEDRKKQYNYSRRNYPLSQVDYEGETFIDPSADPFDIMIKSIEREKMDAAFATLSASQRPLFESVHFEGKKVADIAEEKCVTIFAIYKRMDRILRKLQKFLDWTVQKRNFRAYIV